MEASGFAPGSYQIKVQIQVEDDEDNQVFWLPGQYSFVAMACEGECGSLHPHSRILAQTKANFNVTA